MSGVISGTPTVGGSHTISILAQGGTAEAPKKAIGRIAYFSSTASAPLLGTPSVSNLYTDSAVILAEIESSGSVSNKINFVWDTADKGTSQLSDWNASALNAGVGKEGFYGEKVTGLNPGTAYIYRNHIEVLAGPMDFASDSLSLWLDASDLTAVPNPWLDKSGRLKTI